MALVCDIKSNTAEGEEAPKQDEVDLEEGEIDDDDEETPSPTEEPPNPETTAAPKEAPIASPVVEKEPEKEKLEKERTDKEKLERPERSERSRERARRHDEKGKKHMTEAEKSILHLRRREEAQRRKWEKFNRNKEAMMDSLDDDFAKNIEKTLATILNKKEKEAAALGSGGEEKVVQEAGESRGRKRKQYDKEKKKKRRTVSPTSETDDGSMNNSMMRVSPCGGAGDQYFEGSPLAYSGEDSGESEASERKVKKRERRQRDKVHKKNRDAARILKDPEQTNDKVCVFYLQGKCLKNDCPYSHEAVPPMKLELCKFYLMDCCAKGDKCSYMHSEFPCKFYHTGLNCAQGDNCKFAHGKPLSDGLKQILFKHIETAPRDILGGFPRLNREEVLSMINVTQIKLQQEQMGSTASSLNTDVAGKDTVDPKGGIPSLFDISVPCPPELFGFDGKNDKGGRNRPSRWQDTDSSSGNFLGFPMKNFTYGHDQDMRINSNGDVDMRTLPPPPLGTAPPPSTVPGCNPSPPPHLGHDLCGVISSPSSAVGRMGDVDIRDTSMLAAAPSTAFSKDVDIRQSLLAPPPRDVDIRRLGGGGIFESAKEEPEDEPMLQIDTGEMENKEDGRSGFPPDLPKAQRDLFMRIQSHQKESTIHTESKPGFELDENINWYSDDDDEDDNRLTIKVDNEDVKEKEEHPEQQSTMLSPPQIKPQDVVEKLGDLSKIDISAEVTKLLTSMSQNKGQFPQWTTATQQMPSETADTPVNVVLTDTRIADSRESSKSDPRTGGARNDPRVDPRLAVSDTRQRSRQSSTETASTKTLSIYEQGSIDRGDSGDDVDIDFRSMRSDVDLRSLQLPFKGMQNYTPASEIDASVNSHPPMRWRVTPVDIPRPDYTGLKLSIGEAEKTGDPRLRKIFRLSTEERDTPLSPKASPKHTSTSAPARVDPRLRKVEENKPQLESGTMNFNQQLTILQNSAFYQSLTSNQKLLLNQELNQRNDSSNSHDPVLNTLLSNLNIIPGSNMQSNPNLGAALTILSNVAKLNPIMNQGQLPNIMNQMSQGMGQPGLLGAAPGIPNLPPDFPMNFDPRGGGLLGNVPIPFGSFPNQDGGAGQGNFNFNDDFYEGVGPGGPGGGPVGNFRENRGFNRDRRRGRNFGRGGGGRDRHFRNRNNRSNRTHSPS